MAAELEVVVDRSVSGEELLRMPSRFEPPHVAFMPSGRLVRHLAAIVEIPALTVFDARQDLAFGGTIGSELILHEYSRCIPQTLQQLAKEALGCLRIAAILNQYIEHVAVLINGSSEVVQFASDADENLVQKPLVTGFRPPPLEGVGSRTAWRATSASRTI